MASVNKVFLMGNLTREPEVRQMPSGANVCDFGLAINRRFTNNRGEIQEETCFVDVTIFGRTADVVRNYCHKGDPLFVEGRLRFDQWDDKTTGQRRSRLTVVGENIELIRSRSDGSQGAAPQGNYGSNGGYVPPTRQPFGGAPSYPQNNGGYGQQGPAPQPYAPRQPYNAAATAPAPAAPAPIPPMPSFQSAPPPANPPAQGDAPIEDVPF